MKFNTKEVLKYFILVVLFLAFKKGFSQSKNIITQHQTWTQYFYNIKIHDNYSINGDALYRWIDLDGKASQAGIRMGLTRHLKQNVSIAIGHLYMLHFPSDKNKNAFLDYTRQEHRPWQQLTITTKYGRLNVQHRYRLEQRIMENVPLGKHVGDFRFNQRMRYQINLQYPINKKEFTKGTLSLIAFNEIMLNFGKRIIHDFFDQNRTYIGLGYMFSKSITATVGYQYFWQQRPVPFNYNSTNCLRIALVHNMDWRKKAKE